MAYRKRVSRKFSKKRASRKFTSARKRVPKYSLTRAMKPEIKYIDDVYDTTSIYCMMGSSLSGTSLLLNRDVTRDTGSEHMRIGKKYNIISINLKMKYYPHILAGGAYANYAIYKAMIIRHKKESAGTSYATAQNLAPKIFSYLPTSDILLPSNLVVSPYKLHEVPENFEILQSWTFGLDEARGPSQIIEYNYNGNLPVEYTETDTTGTELNFVKGALYLYVVSTIMPAGTNMGSVACSLRMRILDV